MNERGRACMLLVLSWSLWACTSFDVKTDHDPTADFSAYKTFAFAGLADANKGGIHDNSLTKKRIESAVARELTGKGLRQVALDEHPDLLIHYWMNVQDKQRLESGGTSVGVARYRGGYGWGAGYGGGVTSYEYREGTLILDLVEPEKKQLVWRATIVGMLQNSTTDNVELGNKAIADAFESYPPAVKPH